MKVIIHNVDVDVIKFVCNEKHYALKPEEKIEITNESISNLKIEFRHNTRDRFNTIWYVMHDLFAYEQMRTVLVVDGIFEIDSIYDVEIKIRSKVFYFSKKIGYDSFVFNSYPYCIKPICRQVCDEERIKKRAKVLYMFGGINTVFRICDFALLFSLIFGMFNEHPIVMTVIAGISMLGWLEYIKSLRLLYKSIEKHNIDKYFASDRKEYRRVSDELIESQINLKLDNEIYR